MDTPQTCCNLGARISHTHDDEHGGHGHHHDHGHDHASDVSEGSERRVLWVMVLTGVFMVAEAACGLLSGSLALLADAGHMLTDSAALALA